MIDHTSTAERKKALSRREQRRRGYHGASYEEDAISARAAKKALFRRESSKKGLSPRQQRRRRYLGASSEKMAISAAEVEPFSKLAPI